MVVHRQDFELVPRPIDPTDEPVFDLRQAPKVLAGMGICGRSGKPFHRSFIYRCVANGLETLQIGGRKFTSRAALIRFFQFRTPRRSCHSSGADSKAQAEAAEAGERLRATVFAGRKTFGVASDASQARQSN